MDDVASLQMDLPELVGGKHAEREGCTKRLGLMAQENMDSELIFASTGFSWLFRLDFRDSGVSLLSAKASCKRFLWENSRSGYR
jgi:hypothetical protein